MKKRFLRMRKILLPTLLALVLSMVIVLGGTTPPTSAITQMDPTTTVYLDPPTINGTAVAEEFTVDINIRDSPNMTGWRAAMTFNANLLYCIGFDEGEFLSKGGATYWKKTIDNTLGVLTAACFLLGMGAKVNGSGRLAYATFRVIATGISDLHLRDVEAFEWVDSTEVKIAINIIDVYTAVVDTTAHTVVTVSNSTGKTVEYGSGFYDHAFSPTFKTLSFKVAGPYPGFSNVTIPKTLLPPPEPPRVWAVIINGTSLSIEETIKSENDTYTSMYFTYAAGVNDVQITTRFMPSTISIALSEESISLGESVTISGAIDPVRPNVTVTIHNRTEGDEEWGTLDTVETDSNSNYNYTWTPPENGTYEVKASWKGDNTTLGNESDVRTLTAKWTSVIAIALSSTNITLGESVTVSGNITAADNTVRKNANVTILYRLSGAADWTTLDTVRTDQNGEYTYEWEPETTGTYEAKATWLGDDVTFGNESNVLTLTVEEAPAPAGIPMEIVIVAVVAIVIIAAVVIYYFVRIRK